MPRIFQFATLAFTLAMPALAEQIASLPLTPGYYVSADTACADASNATLMLVHSKGINAAQVECTISSIDQTGPATFAVTDECIELANSISLGATTTLYDIPNDTTFGYVDGSNVVSPFRYCPQSQLPEPWRSNALGN